MRITQPGQPSESPIPESNPTEGVTPVGPAGQEVPVGVDAPTNEATAPLPGGPLVTEADQPVAATPDAGDPVAPEGPVLTDPPKPDTPTGMPAAETSPGADQPVAATPDASGVGAPVVPEAGQPPVAPEGALSEETPQPVGQDTSVNLNQSPTDLEKAVGDRPDMAPVIEPESEAPSAPATELPATDASGDTPSAPVADKINLTTPAGQGSAALGMTPEQHQALKPEAPRGERDIIIDKIAKLHAERRELVNQGGGIDKKLEEIDGQMEELIKQYSNTPEGQPAQTPESLGGESA